MLRQMCRRGRLTAFLRNPVLSEDSFDPMIFLGRKYNGRKNPKGIGLKPVPDNIYEEILAYINKESTPSFRHCKSMPHPKNARVLSRFALRVNQFSHKERQYSTFELHPGNSTVRFEPGSTSGNTGHIESIWRYDLDGNGDLSTFIVISNHQSLSIEDATLNPFRARPGFLVKVVYARNPNDHQVLTIVQSDNIVSHLAYIDRPSGTFGIEGNMTVLIDSLHRNRD